jgi:hypothetical protein
METIANLFNLCGQVIREGWETGWTGLQFNHGPEALAATAVLAMLAVVMIFARRWGRKIPGRTHILLPAVPLFLKPGFGARLRALPYGLALAGVPFLLVAFADPYASYVRQETTNVGRRILILLDASGSMGGGTYGNRFESMSKLKPKSAEPFYTAAAAAEYFVRARMKAGKRDLIGLIEFGDESYIVSPFSTDYENVLTGIRLLSDPEEYMRFDNSGTKIAQAVHQGVRLFRNFDFLNTEGNVMVLISDGEDSEVAHEGRSIESIVSESGRNRVPIFFIRTVSGKPLGDPATYDEVWGAAIAKTGGKLYAGADEEAIIRACDDINRLAAGKVRYTSYGVRTPRFQVFALGATLLWSLALFFWLGLRNFREFP